MMLLISLKNVDLMFSDKQHCQNSLVGIFLRDIHFFLTTEWIDEIKLIDQEYFQALVEKISIPSKH